MSTFEKTTEYIRGKSFTVTSWHDIDSGTWKANAPDYILRFARADAMGQDSRQAAVAVLLRELDELLRRRDNRQ